MRLHEAIRLGSMSCPQAFGATERNGARCALGAGLLAIGRVCDDDIRVLNYFPVAREHSIDPVTGKYRLVISIVRELNDVNRWTREAIADWLEPIELAFEATTESGRGTTAVEQPVLVTRA